MTILYSMTGFSALERDLGTARLFLEIKSVNGRFLDLSFRCPEELRFLEMPLREKFSTAIARGKTDCRLALQTGEPTSRMVPDAARMAQLQALQNEVRTLMPDAAFLSVADILRWPGILTQETLDPDLLRSECLVLADEVLADFISSREREGARLGLVLRSHVATMRSRIEQVELLVPAAIAQYTTRLSTRLREAVATLDEDRIRQEISVFAAKIDVAEELARLVSHLTEVVRVLDVGGTVGKRLDFLMQELNREANTLASKSVSGEVTAIALELKLSIEQMREMVQNLE